MKQNEYIEDLEKRIIQATEQRDKAENKVEKLEKAKQKLETEIKILKKRLAFFVNPHTPSSARKFPKKTDENKPKKKKRGAPKGHKGATRPTPKPEITIEVKADTCENCGGHNLE
ncbi:MAG: hypothetical protein U9R75_04735, partial [Candidatus Thermoplasmatota archaeon]|nr:hypothetical protein [Candidatus Thermoplasmatota archaeon]